MENSMIEFLKRTFIDDHYRNSLRLGPFYLIRGQRIPRAERFSPDSSEGERARGVTVKEELNDQVGADTSFTAILDSRRQTRKGYHATLRSQAQRKARFRNLEKDLTAILKDKEAAATQALAMKGYIAPALPETKKSLGAKTLADLKAGTTFGDSQIETDIKPLPDLPEFLKKLT